MRRELPMILIGHANYPAVTHDQSPASLSRKWITDVLRKKIGYRGLVVSDDLEMGGVLKAAPIERAAVGHIRAGGDLCLICHIEEYVIRSYEELIRTAERETKFARRVNESAARVLAFKKKSAALKRRSPAPERRHAGKTFTTGMGVRRRSAHGPAEKGESVIVKPSKARSTQAMTVAGIMSGTSADGINVALVRVVWTRATRPRTSSFAGLIVQIHRPR